MNSAVVVISAFFYSVKPVITHTSEIKRTNEPLGSPINWKKVVSVCRPRVEIVCDMVRSSTSAFRDISSSPLVLKRGSESAAWYFIAPQ